MASAPTQEIAKRVALIAEQCRKDKAIEWLGAELPYWAQPCPIAVKVTQGGASGATSFGFTGSGISGQSMTVSGNLEEILADVIPHEVTHTVFAWHFGRPVPRWCDEGGACVSEGTVGRGRLEQAIEQAANARKRYHFKDLFGMRDYPTDSNHLMSFYAQSYSVSAFLVEAKGKPAFIAFVATGMRGDWAAALQTHYGYESLEQCQQAWDVWCLKRWRKGPKQQQQQPQQQQPQVIVPQPVVPVKGDRGEKGERGPAGPAGEAANAEPLVAPLRERLKAAEEKLGQHAGELQQLPKLGEVLSDVAGKFGKLAPVVEKVAPIAEDVAQAAGWAKYLPWIAGGAATGGVGALIPLALMAGRAIVRVAGKRSQTVVVSGRPVAQQVEHVASGFHSAPMPAPMPESKYIGVPVDGDEYKALLGAMDDAAQKYPGVVGAVNLIKELQKQRLSSPVKG